MKKKILQLTVFALVLTLNCTCVFASFQTSAGVAYSRESININNEIFSVDVIIVDLSNPEVGFSVDYKGGKTFEEVVEKNNPIAAVSGNFVDSSLPIGNLVAEGKVIHTESGIASMTVSKQGHVYFGKPIIMAYMKTADNSVKRAVSWTIGDINSQNQYGEQSVLYTPDFGQSVGIGYTGWVLTVEEGVIKSFVKAESGRQVNIPQKGYVVYFSQIFTQATYFFTPEIGRKVEIDYFMINSDLEKLDFSNISSVISGSPKLVENGLQTYTVLEPSFSAYEEAMTGKSEKTAVGKLKDGRLIFVHGENVTISQMKQIMIKLNCTEAINLLSGELGSIYVNGVYIKKSHAEVSSTVLINKISR